MRTFFECIPCFLRQALDAVRHVTRDEAVHEQVLRQVLRAAADMDRATNLTGLSEPTHGPGPDVFSDWEFAQHLRQGA
jgi:uncharacterized protein with ATP-grasp and redox domains